MLHDGAQGANMNTTVTNITATPQEVALGVKLHKAHKLMTQAVNEGRATQRDLDLWISRLTFEELKALADFYSSQRVPVLN